MLNPQQRRAFRGYNKRIPSPLSTGTESVNNPQPIPSRVNYQRQPQLPATPIPSTKVNDSSSDKATIVQPAKFGNVSSDRVKAGSSMDSVRPRQPCDVGVCDENEAYDFKLSIQGQAYRTEVQAHLNIGIGEPRYRLPLQYWSKALSNLTTIKQLDNYLQQRTQQYDIRDLDAEYKTMKPITRGRFKVVILRRLSNGLLNNAAETTRTPQCSLLGQRQGSSVSMTELLNRRIIDFRSGDVAYERLCAKLLNQAGASPSQEKEVFSLCFQAESMNANGGNGPHRKWDLICIGELSGLTKSERQNLQWESDDLRFSEGGSHHFLHFYDECFLPEHEGMARLHHLEQLNVNPMKASLISELSQVKTIDALKNWVRQERTWDELTKCQLLGLPSSAGKGYHVFSDNFRIVVVDTNSKNGAYTLRGQERRTQVSELKELDREILDFQPKNRTFSAIYEKAKRSSDGKAYIFCYERSPYRLEAAKVSVYCSHRLACIGELIGLTENEKGFIRLDKAEHRGKGTNEHKFFFKQGFLPLPDPPRQSTSAFARGDKKSK